MDLHALQLFVQVAELGSFTRAGEKLGYSQPTVSFQIRQLEQELGVPLFDRIGRHVSLTAAGHDALDYAQRICRLSQEMALGAAGKSEPEGLVRLAMADSLCGPLVAEGFADFHRRYPGVTVHITTAGTDELFSLLDHNLADIVCTLDSHIYDTAYTIAAEERIDVHFIAAAQHPMAKQKAITLREILTQPLLLTEKGMSYRRLLDEVLAQRSLAAEPVLELGHTDLLCELVAQGTGVSFLPDHVTHTAQQAGHIVRLPVPEVEIAVWKQLLYRQDKWISPPMRAVLEHLRQLSLAEQAILPQVNEYPE